jgi:hypothetical protein
MGQVEILGRSYDRDRPVKRFFKLYVALIRIRDVLSGVKRGKIHERGSPAEEEAKEDDDEAQAQDEPEDQVGMSRK